MTDRSAPPETFERHVRRRQLRRFMKLLVLIGLGRRSSWPCRLLAEGRKAASGRNSGAGLLATSA
jgi:hypothetical protein